MTMRLPTVALFALILAAPLAAQELTADALKAIQIRSIGPRLVTDEHESTQTQCVTRSLELENEGLVVPGGRTGEYTVTSRKNPKA